MYFYNIKLFKSATRNYTICCSIPQNYYKKIFFFFNIYKISEKTINFEDKKIDKKDFYNNKKKFNIKDIDINKILISKPELYDKNNVRKYIIGYNDNTIRPLQLFLPKMTGYLNIFESGTRNMSFLTDNNEFLERYTATWEKISNLINKKLIVTLFITINI